MAFIVLMPDGFTLTDAPSVGGQHDYEFDFPWLSDRYWVGWVGPQMAEPERTMITLSHELVEMLTDPERDGWRWDPIHKFFTEISDRLFAPEGDFQTIFVNGVQVQSYWSRRHGAPVIPIDRDYGAQLSVTIKETSRKNTDTGEFELTPEERTAACRPDLPECCYEDRKYQWFLYSIDEIARVRLNKRRFVSPKMDNWQINGKPVSGEGDLPITSEAVSFDGLTAVHSPVKTLSIHYKVVPSGIDITTNSLDANFSVTVGCAVTETAITGNNLNNVIALPSIEVPFTCAEALPEDAYTNRLSRCLTAMARRFDVQYKPTGKPGRGEPINFIAELLKQEPLPAYVRPSHYAQVRLAVKAMRAANALLPADLAKQFGQSLVRRIPALQVLADKRERNSLKGEEADR
jgi:hypothetical protein